MLGEKFHQSAQSLKSSDASSGVYVSEELSVTMDTPWICFERNFRIYRCSSAVNSLVLLSPANSVKVVSALSEDRMTSSWDNRVRFVVRYIFDIDNNGFLDKNDFEAMALRSTVLGGQGTIVPAKYEANKKLYDDLWNKITELCDFDKNGEVTADEFKDGMKAFSAGKAFVELPKEFQAFIADRFALIDINTDGLIGVEEYRHDCISRVAFKDIESVDAAFEALLSDEDRARGGIDITTYQNLYAAFIGCQDATHRSANLFGPLPDLSS